MSTTAMSQVPPSDSDKTALEQRIRGVIATYYKAEVGGWAVDLHKVAAAIGGTLVAESGWSSGGSDSGGGLMEAPRGGRRERAPAPGSEGERILRALYDELDGSTVTLNQCDLRGNTGRGSVKGEVAQAIDAQAAAYPKYPGNGEPLTGLGDALKASLEGWIISGW